MKPTHITISALMVTAAVTTGTLAPAPHAQASPSFNNTRYQDICTNPHNSANLNSRHPSDPPELWWINYHIVDNDGIVTDYNEPLPAGLVPENGDHLFDLGPYLIAREIEWFTVFINSQTSCTAIRFWRAWENNPTPHWYYRTRW